MTRAPLVAVLAVLLLASLDAAERPASPPEPAPGEARPEAPPRDIGLLEKTGTGLAQLDVTVEGPPDVVGTLTADDFEVVIAGKPVDDLFVDRLCTVPTDRASVPEPQPESGAPAASRAPAVSAAPPVNYLLYFDQHELTMSGRQRAIELAQQMLPGLLEGGNRVSVMSTGERLTTLAELTTDEAALRAAIAGMENDRSLWDMYPQLEQHRIAEVVGALRTNGIELACARARTYQQEEAFRTEKALRLLSIAIGRLAALDPPKVVVYFADTMRATAGQHYYGYVGRCPGVIDESGNAKSSFGAEHSLDRLIEDAAAQGIRIYTVQAQGLVNSQDMETPGLGSTSIASDSGGSGLGGDVNPLANDQRFRDAQDGLAGMALETGGQAFLNGVPAPKMMRRLREDLGCMYLVSFDPTGFPEDTGLPVVVRVRKPKVEARTRGRIVFQSESARRTSRLLTAFALPEAVGKDVGVRGTLIPTGFVDGRFTALVQLQADASPVAEAAWDLGLSIVSGDRVRDDRSARITLDRPGVPVVFETEVSFRPGPYELILVAHETVTDRIGTARIEGAFPEALDGPAALDVSVLQPADAAFLRDGVVRRQGALGRADGDLVRTDRPTAIVGLVCRGKSARGAQYRVERVLEGEAETAFPPEEIDLRDERCAQVRDLIHAGTMTPGNFTYRVRVLDGDKEIAASERTFAAVDDTIRPGAPDAG